MKRVPGYENNGSNALLKVVSLDRDNIIFKNFQLGIRFEQNKMDAMSNDNAWRARII